MAITTKAQLDAAMNGGQRFLFSKIGGPGIGASAVWGDASHSLGGSPAGVSPAANTTSGIVPTSASMNVSLNGFAGGNTGYLGDVSLSVQSPAAVSQNVRVRLSDMLFKAGTYPFNASQALSAQPSYSSRVPGADYKGTEIWFKAQSSFTGNPTVVVTYTNQDGVAGQTATLALGVAPILYRMYQFPLAAGDTGVQKIESVTATVATVGTFDIMVIRPLWMGEAVQCGDRDTFYHGPDRTGTPILYSNSALFWQQMNCGNTALCSFDAFLTIING